MNKLQKKLLAIFFSLAAGAVAFWIIFTQFSFKEVIQSFIGAPLWAIIAYILVSILIMGTYALRWQSVLSAQGHRITFKNAFFYKLVGYAVSYLTPGAKVGGEAVRAGLLKRQGLTFQEGLSSVVIDKILELSTSGFFFVVGAVVAFSTHDFPIAMKAATLVVSGWLLLLLTYFYYRMLKGKECFTTIFTFLGLHKGKKGKTIEKKLRAFEALLIKFYHKDRKKFLVSIAISLISWLLMFVEYKLILVILGIQHTTFMQLFLIITFIGAAYLIPVPMALGALEAGQLSVFSIIGYKDTAGIALALITRTKDLVWTAIGFIALSYYGLSISKSVQEARFISEDVDRLKKTKK